jgi:hypothetical protein
MIAFSFIHFFFVTEEEKKCQYTTKENGKETLIRFTRYYRCFMCYDLTRQQRNNRNSTHKEMNIYYKNYSSHENNCHSAES